MLAPTTCMVPRVGCAIPQPAAEPSACGSPVPASPGRQSPVRGAFRFVHESAPIAKRAPFTFPLSRAAGLEPREGEGTTPFTERSGGCSHSGSYDKQEDDVKRKWLGRGTILVALVLLIVGVTA